MGGPQLELGVAVRADLEKIVLPAIMKLELGHELRVAAFQTFRETQQGGQHANHSPIVALQIANPFVGFFGRVAAMVACDERHELDFRRLESAEIAVLDQIVRVLVVSRVADVDANVVHQRGVLQPFPFAVRQAMNGSCLIEQRRSQPGHLLRVLWPVAASLAQLDDTSPADVGILVDLGNVLPVARDVVEDKPFSQRVVTERELLCAKLAQDRIEQHRPRNKEIDAPRIDGRQLEALVDVLLEHGLSEPVHRLARDAKIAHLGRSSTPVGCPRHGAETQNGA
jgi:hypothetical protein